MTLEGLIALFVKSAGFAARAERTQRNLRTAFSHLAPLYDRAVVYINKGDIIEIAEELPPGSQTNFLNGASTLFNWAMDRMLVSVNPAARIERAKLGTFRPVTAQEYEAIRDGAVEPVRLAAIIGRNTAQRVGDVLRLGWDNVIQTIQGDLAIKLVQRKTKTELVIPVSEELLTALMGLPYRTGYFVRSVSGIPYYDSDAFRRLWRSECDRLGLPKDVVFHGLRKAAAIAVAENGGTLKEIMAFGGWKDPKEAMGYIEAADQLKLARGAVEKLNG